MRGRGRAQRSSALRLCVKPLSRRLWRVRELEAPVGFEPAVELLQSSALPLGHGAPRPRTENGAQGEI